MKLDLRKLARGQDCQLRLHEDDGTRICNFDSSTVVLCHARFGAVAGTGIKPPDLCGFYACSECHSVADRRDSRWKNVSNLYRDILSGICRTLAIVSKELE